MIPRELGRVGRWLRGCAHGITAVALLCAACATHAAPIFKCAADGAAAFQSTPCEAHTRQTVLDVREQPLIDPDAPSGVPAVAFSHIPHNTSHFHTPRVARSKPLRARAAKQAVSWECRAGDGEIFYRHARCPHSVRGDGTVREAAADSSPESAHGKKRRARGAWGSLPVSARKVSRAEACRQINATVASARDGYARDERVSVYDHDTGRDLCKGY